MTSFTENENRVRINLVTIILLVFLQVSCEKDTFNTVNQDRALPVIESSTENNEIEAYQGQTVRETVSMNAQAGIFLIDILLNGEPYETIEGVSGQVGYEYTIQYQIPDNAQVGSELVYRFILKDKDNRTIDYSFTIAVVEAPPVPDFEFEDVVIGGNEYKLINLDINTDISLTNEHDYLLRGKITLAKGYKLSIEEGTSIYAEPNSALVISAGSQIIAEGSENDPIRFTSINEHVGTANRGDWIGLFIHGLAPTTANHPSIIRDYGEYGGSNNEDNSGKLNYVEIAYAGGEADPNMSNGTARALANGALNLNGVGNNTLIEHVFVNNSGISRTGVSISGGSVQLKYVFINNPEGRGLLTKGGYSGTIQYLAIIYQDSPGSAFTAIDVYGSSSDDIPLLSNVSINGGGVSNTRGIRVRNESSSANSPYTGGGKIEIYNTWIANTGNPGLRTDNVNDVVFAYGRIFDVGTPYHSSAIQYNKTGSPYYNGNSSILITDNYLGVDAAGAIDPNMVDNRFESAAYIGAVNPNHDWTKSWVHIP